MLLEVLLAEFEEDPEKELDMLELDKDDETEELDDDAEEVVDELDDDGLLELLKVLCPELLLRFIRNCRVAQKTGLTYRRRRAGLCHDTRGSSRRSHIARSRVRSNSIWNKGQMWCSDASVSLITYQLLKLKLYFHRHS